MSRTEIWVAERPRLMGIAYRVLGSWHDAEDVVAEIWVRFEAQSELRNPQGWLTTATTRLAIDQARRMRARREEYIGPWLPEPVSEQRLPEENAELHAFLRLGLLRMMEMLEPEDRAIFVLREAFEVPYAEIAACVGRSAAACRQVVSRAKRQLPNVVDDDIGQPDHRLVTALLSALATGEVSEVVQLLSEDCVLWSDANGTAKAALHPIYGPEKISRFLVGITKDLDIAAPEPIRINAGWSYLFVWPGGVRLVTLEVQGHVVDGIQIHMNPAKLEFVS